jgi:hypothetical protein
MLPSARGSDAATTTPGLDAPANGSRARRGPLDEGILLRGCRSVAERASLTKQMLFSVPESCSRKPAAKNLSETGRGEGVGMSTTPERSEGGLDPFLYRRKKFSGCLTPRNW